MGSFYSLSSGLLPGFTTQNDRRCWVHPILSYMEQSAISAQVEQWCNAGNSSWTFANRMLTVHFYVCPSDPNVPKNVNGAWSAGAGGDPATSQGIHGNYVACAGSTEFNPGTDNHGLDLNGVFYSRSRTRLTQIADGTSNTLMLSEQLVTPDDHAAPLYQGHDYTGRYFNSLRGGPLFTTLRPPNSPVGDRCSANCCREELPNAPCASSGREAQYARSRHPGGVNAAMCDGSARFVSNSVSADAWLWAGTRAGSAGEGANTNLD